MKLIFHFSLRLIQQLQEYIDFHLSYKVYNVLFDIFLHRKKHDS